MRRPWELAHMPESPAGGPRVYVPITLPDTSSSTFAVLELVGFSSSSPSPFPESSLSPVATLCHSQLPPLSFSLPTSQSFPAPNSTEIPTESSITSLTGSSTTCLHIPSVLSAHGINPAHSIDAAVPSSSPPAVATKPAVLNGIVPVVPIQIKENVVHTTSLNFKDIVQKLTGAASSGKDVMSPMVKLAPTLAGARDKAVTKKTCDTLSVKMDGTKGFKKTLSKLQQRRKSRCNLDQKLCTDKGLRLSISPLSPSPVTPLASYFRTTASPSSGRSSGVSSPEASLPEFNSPNTSIIVPYTANTAEPFSSGNGGARAVSKLQQNAPIKETLYAPALLSLFPESPL